MDWIKSRYYGPVACFQESKIEKKADINKDASDDTKTEKQKADYITFNYKVYYTSIPNVFKELNVC